ncbi:MAG: DoxX family protein [Ilumatobacter sp.]|uniref:DoxX family protein n=1 Tax=Ilumatobacter sp. TaxID=1967498 RepID=UPI003C71F589
MHRPTTFLNALRPYMPLVVRLALGFLLIVHGLDKFDTGLGNVGDAFDGWGVPFPEISATFVAVFEVVGGIALLLGIGTRYVALAMIGVLVGAMIFVKFEIGVLGGYETDLAYIAGLASLVATGPGLLSADSALGIDRELAVGAPADRQRVDA